MNKCVRRLFLSGKHHIDQILHWGTNKCLYDRMCKETVPFKPVPSWIIFYRGIRKCLTEGCMAECIRGLFLSCKHHQLISVSNYMYISATGQMLFKIGRLMEKFQNLCTGQLCKDGTCIPKDETCSKYHFPTILATLIFVYQFYYQTMSYWVYLLVFCGDITHVLSIS